MATDAPSDWLARLGARPGSRRQVAWFGGLFIAAIVASAAWDIVRGYQASVANTGRELESQARVIAEQTARSIQAVDVVLRQLVEQHEAGTLAALDAEALHRVLKDKAVGLVQTDGLALLNADGSVRATSLAPPQRVPPIDLRGEAPFEESRRAPGSGLQIAEALRSAGTGRWVFPISRRLQTAAGGFAGVVAAPGRVDYFQRFYRDAFPDPGTRVALLHRRATLLARHPPADDAIGRRFAIVDELLARAAAGETFTRNVSPLDGVDRFGATRLVPDYPLVVIVTRDAAAALAPWREQALGSALRTLALAAFAALLIALLWRQIGRLQAAGASLAVQQERYALAAAGSDDGIWDWDLASGTAYESARARELQGLPRGPETQPLGELQAQLTVHPDDAPRRHEALAAHLEGRTPAYEVEYRVRQGDGQYRWIHVRALCIRGADGRALRIAGSVTDVDQRRRAEEALRASEERFALAVEGTNDGIVDWNLDADRIYTSPRARQIFGVGDAREHHSIAQWLAEIPLHPDDRPRHDEDFNRHLRGEAELQDRDYRVARPDGSYRWVRVRGKVVSRRADGRAARWAGSVSDIDAYKRTEEALRRSEERYALAMTGSNEGHWLWDIPDGRIYVSARLAELFGFPGGAQEMAAADYFARLPLHPDDRERVHRSREDHVAGRTERLDHEFRIVVPGSGEQRWMHTRAQCFRDAAGRPLRMAGSTVDATRRKAAELALRESEERYALAMTGSRGGHWVWDAASDGLFVSGTVNELFGLPPETVPTTRSAYFARVRLHPDDQARIAQIGADLLAGRLSRAEYEFRILLPGGGERWILTRAQRFDGTDPRGTRIAGVSVDISDRKQAEGERDRLELQLRQAQKLEAIGTLAGGIAHDFNNILSAILGYGELAQRDAPPGTPLRRHVDAALAAGARAKSLVERILAFSRSGVGERVPVHVQSVVAEALDAVGASLPAGVTLARRLAAGDAAVLGDATQIHQVVLNLCANAVQAMKGGGRLEVAVEPVRLAAPQAVATSTLAPGDYLRLAVRDEGAGMAPRVLERIFDPFFTTKEVGVGTGLGLSLVHGIVTDLGGGIGVESHVGAGSRFDVWLPATGVVAPPRAEAGAVPHGNGQAVLLVDDEEALVRLNEETLAELGYEPVGFTTAAAALEALQREPQRFDIVLSDESMPGMTGSELALAVRRLRPDLPVVLMSGLVGAALLERAQAAGVAEVLGKPLAAREIARALAAALAGGLRGAAR